MDQKILEKLLEDFKSNKVSLEEVLGKLKGLPFEDLGFAKVDHHRALRKGFPEIHRRCCVRGFSRRCCRLRAVPVKDHDPAAARYRHAGPSRL